MPFHSFRSSSSERLWAPFCAKKLARERTAPSRILFSVLASALPNGNDVDSVEEEAEAVDGLLRFAGFTVPLLPDLRLDVTSADVDDSALAFAMLVMVSGQAGEGLRRTAPKKCQAVSEPTFFSEFPGRLRKPNHIARDEARYQADVNSNVMHYKACLLNANSRSNVLAKCRRRCGSSKGVRVCVACAGVSVAVAATSLGTVEWTALANGSDDTNKFGFALSSDELHTCLDILGIADELEAELCTVSCSNNRLVCIATSRAAVCGGLGVQLDDADNAHRLTDRSGMKHHAAPD